MILGQCTVVFCFVPFIMIDMFQSENKNKIVCKKSTSLFELKYGPIIGCRFKVVWETGFLFHSCQCVSVTTFINWFFRKSPICKFETFKEWEVCFNNPSAPMCFRKHLKNKISTWWLTRLIGKGRRKVENYFPLDGGLEISHRTAHFRQNGRVSPLSSHSCDLPVAPVAWWFFLPICKIFGTEE